jgi:hypothetical protein
VTSTTDLCAGLTAERQAAEQTHVDLRARDCGGGPMARAWREAAPNPGIGLESPFVVKHLSGGFWCAGLLPDFGSTVATTIAGLESSEGLFKPFLERR